MSKFKFRRNRKRDRNKSHTQHSQNIYDKKIAWLSPKPPPEAVNFYQPGKCSICKKSSDPMPGTAWKSNDGDWYACFFCFPCIVTVMQPKTISERGDYYRQLEMEIACEIAQQAFEKGGAK